MPVNESNMDPIRSFSLISIEKGLDGLLLTLWDDDSPHFELYNRGIIFFAEYTWAGDKRSKEELKTAYRSREYSQQASNPEYVFIDLPDSDKKGEWSLKYADRLKQAATVSKDCEIIAARIGEMKSLPVRNLLTLEIYEQVNEFVNFSSTVLLALNAYDTAENEEDIKAALERIGKLEDEFLLMRSDLEEVYAKSRILTKPENFILDGNRHNHTANQSISFDWLFNAELFLLEKIQSGL